MLLNLDKKKVNEIINESFHVIMQKKYIYRSNLLAR